MVDMIKIQPNNNGRKQFIKAHPQETEQHKEITELVC